MAPGHVGAGMDNCLGGRNGKRSRSLFAGQSRRWDERWLQLVAAAMLGKLVPRLLSTRTVVTITGASQVDNIPLRRIGAIP